MADVENDDFTPESPGGGAGGHVFAASLAAVFSIAVHGLLAFVVSRVDMSFFSRLKYTPPERQYPALQIGSVEVSEVMQSQVLTALRELGQAQPPDVTRSVDEMQVAPEVGVTEPPALKELADLPPELAGVSEPELAPPSDQWMPRQEILAIENVAVGDALAGLERRMIPAIERITSAPDVVLPVSSSQMGKPHAEGFPVASPSPQMQNRVAAPAPSDTVDRAPVVVQTESGHELFEEKAEDIRDIEPVDQLLTARVEIYHDRRDSKSTYFRLVVERAGEQLLPVRQKDIMLVQDASASMAEQRLYFCREAMRRSLAHIGTADRFNVAKFADRTEFCFPDWVAKTPETLTRAEAFINDMQAVGNTDLFTSMQDLLKAKRQPGRPVIAFVITDGLVNMGLTDSTDIIGAFTRENQGRISVFTMGVSALANRYLIDLLSYCNCGSVKVVESGRWDIPEAAETIMRGIQRPVLSDLSLQLGADSSVEMYPQQVGNLYLDRPLVLFGKCNRDERLLVFQALGMAGKTQCDMIFDLPLTASETGADTRGDASIRDLWAQQKIYHLLGVYARTRDKSVLRELRSTGREYDQPVPYRSVIGL